MTPVSSNSVETETASAAFVEDAEIAEPSSQVVKNCKQELGAELGCELCDPAISLDWRGEGSQLNVEQSI